MCKSPDIKRPPEGIGGYRPTTEGMCRISAEYGEGHVISRPCVGRVMREIGVPSPRHLSTHYSLSFSYPWPFSSVWPSLWPSPTAPTSSDPCYTPGAKHCSSTLRVRALGSNSIARLHHLRSPYL